MKTGIRVDGGFHIGLGHIYKTLWLAEALRRKGAEVTFLASDDPAAISMIHRQNFATRVLPASWDERQKIQFTNEWTRAERPDVFIIDHWDWPEVYWQTLEKTPQTLWVGIDAPPEGFASFDLALQGIRNDLTDREYTAGACRVFEGLKYLMIAPEFTRYAGTWRPPEQLRNILLTFGGTDVAGFSLKILARFAAMPRGFALTLVLGPGSDMLDGIAAYLRATPLPVTIVQDAPCLPALMSRAGLVISTSGACTLAELALTGAPAIALAAVPHQTSNAIKYAQRGGLINCAHEAGEIPPELTTHVEELRAAPQRLAELSARWNGLVDGKGIERIVSLICERRRPA